MDAQLKQMAQIAREQFRAGNPAGGLPLHPGTALQQMVVDSRKPFDMDDLIEAARESGVAERDIDAFTEELASWL